MRQLCFIHFLIFITLICLHIIFEHRIFKIDQEYSISEIYELLLFSSASVIIWKSQIKGLKPLSLLIAFFAADNLLGIHELTGVEIAKNEQVIYFADQIKIKTQSVAELVYFSILGLISSGVSVYSLIKTDKVNKNLVFGVISCIMIIFIGGVVVDFMRDTKYLNLPSEWAGLVEDSIELQGIITLFLFVYQSLDTPPLGIYKKKLAPQSSTPNLPSQS